MYYLFSPPPPPNRNVPDVEVVDLVPAQVEEPNGAGPVDVVVGSSISHQRENLHPSTVAETNNAKSRGEDDQNRNMDITGRLTT